MADKYFKFEDRTVPFKMSPIDIIIPCRNNHGMVSRLVEGIFNTVHTNRYQISIVDDGGDNAGYVTEYSDIPGVVTHRHSKEQGYAECFMTALKSTEQPWVLYVEPEIKPMTNNWLLHLGQTLLSVKDRGVKMVGPRMDHIDEGADTRQQVAKSNGLEGTDVILEDTHLSLYCFLCHRELLGRIGLPKEWTSLELARLVRGRGFGQSICATSWVHHESM